MLDFFLSKKLYIYWKVVLKRVVSKQLGYPFSDGHTPSHKTDWTPDKSYRKGKKKPTHMVMNGLWLCYIRASMNSM